MKMAFVQFDTTTTPVYINIETIASLRAADSKVDQPETEIRTVDGQVFKVLDTPMSLLDRLCAAVNHGIERGYV